MMGMMILVLLGVVYYQSAKSHMLAEHRLSMQLEGERYLPQLVKWMQGEIRDFPKDPAYNTAFYIDDKQIAGRVDIPVTDLSPGMHMFERYIYLVIPMGSYGLKGARTVMMTADDRLWIKTFWQNSVIFGTLLFAILLLTGIALSHLFLKPMKAAVALLDSFIKDTTHELNTPVTAILTNVEQLESVSFDEKTRKKIMRIETAAQTIGAIYDDLTLLLLRGETAGSDETFDLLHLMHERLNYFQTRFAMKQLQVQADCQGRFFVKMNRDQAARLIDNLLSNAAKYSDRNTEVHVVFDQNERKLMIENSGPPIAQEKLEKIFERYMRADTSQGGFGIGLHLVARIAARYGIRIEVYSENNRTRFALTWPRYTPQPL